MKVQGTHEGCIEQISRLFHEKLFVEKPVTDEQGRIRMDDWELSDEVQDKVMECWKNVTTENVAELSDIDGFGHILERHKVQGWNFFLTYLLTAPAPIVPLALVYGEFAI